MNCLKSINLTREYGNLRLSLISALFSVTYFIVYFMFFKMSHPDTIFIQTGLFEVLFMTFLVIPMHSFLHCLPIWLSGNKASIVLGENRFSFFCRIPQVLTRRVALTAVSSPIVVITVLALLGPLFFPEYLHLFSIVSAMNIFLSTKDMIYIIHLWKAPKDSYLEDGSTGFQIIVRRTF